MKTLIQAPTLNALMLGNFDETVSVKDFLHHADTGIGTYAGLDGEAIFEDGVAYKATADGKVVVMKPEDGVAFGTVARFDESVPTAELRDIADIEAMKKALAPYVAGNQNIGLIMDVPLEVTVELGRTKKSISEILDFAPGTIIELDRIAGEPIDVLVNGKFVAKGEVVVIEESFGVRVTEIIK